MQRFSGVSHSQDTVRLLDSPGSPSYYRGDCTSLPTIFRASLSRAHRPTSIEGISRLARRPFPVLAERARDWYIGNQPFNPEVHRDAPTFEPSCEQDRKQPTSGGRMRFRVLSVLAVLALAAAPRAARAQGE